jgi:hypothetical protein
MAFKPYVLNQMRVIKFKAPPKKLLVLNKDQGLFGELGVIMKISHALYIEGMFFGMRKQNDSSSYFKYSHWEPYFF